MTYNENKVFNRQVDESQLYVTKKSSNVATVGKSQMWCRKPIYGS